MRTAVKPVFLKTFPAMTAGRIQSGFMKQYGVMI